MSQIQRLVSEARYIEEFKKTAVCQTFEIVEVFEQRWKIVIHGPIDSKFEGMVIPFSIMFNDNFPWEAPFITCLETVEGTNFLKNEVMTFDNFSSEPWDQSIKILTILLSIQNYMASIKKEIPRSETYCSNSEEESDPADNALPNRPPPLETVSHDRIGERLDTVKESVPEEKIQEQINALREPDTQERIPEPSNELNSVNGRNSKAKKERKAGPKAARKRASTSKKSLEPARKKISKKNLQALPESLMRKLSQLEEQLQSQAVDEKIKAARIKAQSTSTTSLDPARKKISKNIQQALPESSQLGESQAVDEKINAARMKAQKVKEEYDASLKELDRALEEKLKTHEAELLEVQRKIQETLEKRKKLKEDLQNL